jgi:hypothetical protein
MVALMARKISMGARREVVSAMVERYVFASRYPVNSPNGNASATATSNGIRRLRR